MNAGDLDRKITIQQISRAKNSTGEEVETLSTFAEPRAQVTPIRGAEPQVSQTQAGQQQARFRIRHLTGLKMEMKILYDGLTWDITEFRPIGRNEGIDIIALTVRN